MRNAVFLNIVRKYWLNAIKFKEMIIIKRMQKYLTFLFSFNFYTYLFIMFVVFCISCYSNTFLTLSVTFITVVMLHELYFFAPVNVN